MKKHVGIDAAIISAIKGGHSDFGSISSRPYVASAAKEHITASKPEFRVIDGRLQALRKAGQIAYSRKAGWVMINATTSGKKA